ncbi:MAG TPA: hypothetical protein VMU49_06815 [Candidatus Acidoferrales bacterium]|nr:hypothetical protein [Candidatus Acidoferrales bacterium]
MSALVVGVTWLRWRGHLAGYLLAALALGGWLAAGPGFAVATEQRVMLAALAAVLLLLGLFSPSEPGLGEVLWGGLLGLALVALAVSGPSLTWWSALVLALAAGCAALGADGGFAERLRAPAIGVVMIGSGQMLIAVGGNVGVERVGALALALGLVALAGLVPFGSEITARGPATPASLAWAGFLGPALVLGLVARVLPHLTPDEAEVYSAVLIGLGLVNLFAGVFGAWGSIDPSRMWRFSFIADWGLVLVGLGLLSPAAIGVGYLALLGIVVVRMPLYVWSRRAIATPPQEGLSRTNLLVAAALAGAAPFAGFSVRLLLLQAASSLFWPLAAVLVVAMLCWPAHAFRLARSLGRPDPRTRWGFGLVLAASLALGVVPGLVLSLGGY